ncbi:hypothetical protein THAOC_27579, partial [Thalassiosira oceanica]
RADGASIGGSRGPSPVLSGRALCRYGRAVPPSVSRLRTSDRSRADDENGPSSRSRVGAIADPESTPLSLSPGLYFAWDRREQTLTWTSFGPGPSPN